MDAYDLQQKLLTEWRGLALVPNPDSVKKVYNDVSVCVKIDDKIYTVTDAITEDGKIFLELK